jgi:outer membrane protein TolC
VPARNEVMRQTLLQYNAMQVGVFQVLQARQQELDTELAYVETLREYWSAKAALDALLAGHTPAFAVMASPRASGASVTAGGH